MFNVGFAELLAILVLALVVLGPGRFADAVRAAGRVMGELRRISGDFQQELLNAHEDRQVDDELERPGDTQSEVLDPPPANGAAPSDQAAETARAPGPTTSQPATSRPNQTGPASG